MSRNIIFATNISSGGGKSLLLALLSDMSSGSDVLVFLDSRLELPSKIESCLMVKYIKPTIFHRALAQLWLHKNVSESDKVLCFGSLPPLFRLKCKTTLFIQNRYLLGRNSLSDFNFKTRSRLIFERIRFRLGIKNSDEFIVQSDSMKSALLVHSWATNLGPIFVRPFLLKRAAIPRPINCSNEAQSKEVESYKFVYVASGEPHKNHATLIEAWCLLAQQGLFPSLYLTLNENSDVFLCNEIKAKQSAYGLNIVNFGAITSEQVEEIYSNSCALIYPSTLESFGLPLIEARNAGLFVLASELDYVRDFIDPDQTFDPYSAKSIARAVKRFMGVVEMRPDMLDGPSFLNLLFGRNLK